MLLKPFHFFFFCCAPFDMNPTSQPGKVCWVTAPISYSKHLESRQGRKELLLVCRIQRFVECSPPCFLHDAKTVRRRRFIGPETWMCWILKRLHNSNKSASVALLRYHARWILHKFRAVWMSYLFSITLWKCPFGDPKEVTLSKFAGLMTCLLL